MNAQHGMVAHGIWVHGVHGSFSRLFGIAACLIALVIARQASAQTVPTDAASADTGSQYHPSYVTNEYHDGTAPLHVHYQLLFRDLLADHSLLAALPQEDVVILQDLRSPQDIRFIEAAEHDMEQLCTAFDKQPAVVDVQQMALQFESSRRRHERSLDAYYEAATYTLSADTRALVESLLVEQTAKQIAYARVDLSGLAAADPAAALTLLQAACTRFDARSGSGAGPASLLDMLHSHPLP